jgi:hypothetical protein
MTCQRMCASLAHAGTRCTHSTDREHSPGLVASLKKLPQFCCLCCHLLPCAYGPFLVQVQLVSLAALTLLPLAQPDAQQTARPQYAAQQQRKQGQQWQGQQPIDSSCTVGLYSSWCWWVTRTLQTPVVCSDLATEGTTHFGRCASALSSSSYTSSFFSKSPGLRGST